MARRSNEGGRRRDQLPRDDGRSNYARIMAEMGPYLQLGWVFLGGMLAGLGIGWWLDGKLGTRPWLMVVGLVLGMAAGFTNLIKVTMRPKQGGEDRR